jgi:hypothetical protein
MNDDTMIDSAAKDPASMTDLRGQLSQIYGALMRGELKHDEAKEFANVAGKIIKSADVQTKYALARGEVPSIPFMA